MPAPSGGKYLAEELKFLQDEGVQVLVSLLPENQSKELELENESDLCKLNGIEFVLFPISDHDVPDSFSDAKFHIMRIAGSLAQGKSVVIHCWGGIGRSAMIAAAVLCMRGILPTQSFSLIQAARGEKVPETPQQENWVWRFAQEYGA